MPTVETFTPPNTPTPIGPYNHVAKVGQFITIDGTAGVELYELKHPKGKVVVAAYRLENGDRVLDYIWQRLLDQARQPQS